MAVPLVVPQCALLRLVWRKGGADWAVNVLGVENATPVTINQALANTLSTAIQATFNSSGLKTLVHTSWSLRQIGIRDINIANQFEYIGTAGATSGTGAGSPLPDQVAYCATIRTLLAGKSYRGRYYQPGLIQSTSDTSGVPTGAATGAVVAFVTGINANLVTSGLRGAVISRKLHTHTNWDTISARNTTWSTQRRRLLPGI
jgi:hypothetical protein